MFNVLELCGEIDAFTAPILRERLAAANNRRTSSELNLSDVSYMDSTGLGVFVGFYKACKANEWHM